MEIMSSSEPSCGGESGLVREPFEWFFEREFPSMVSLAYATTGSRLLAEDLAQEAFVAAYRDWEVCALRARSLGCRRRRSTCGSKRGVLAQVESCSSRARSWARNA
ncbi:MAG: hypothetical protein GY929_11120 [Actinomycetia bacterium]|nr:hypothetical protein [Actinomycetes bacterium]